MSALAAAVLWGGVTAPAHAAGTPAADGPLTMRQVDLGGSRQAELRRLLDEENARVHRQPGTGKSGPGGVVTTPGAPKIGQVNGKAFDQVRFTPGASYVVQGAGFGTEPGQVRIAGRFPGGAMPVMIDRWGDAAVVLRVPSALGGVEDQDGLVLQLRTSAGQQATVTGARFVAARETITFSRGPRLRMTWGPPLPRLNDTPGVRLHVQRHAGVPEPSPHDVLGQPGVGSVAGCASTGTDEFDFSGLAPGFALTGYHWGYEQTPETTVTLWEGDAASFGQKIERRVIHAGAYSVERQGSVVRLHWAATHWQYVRSFGAFTYRCDAKYAIAFRLEGPRGVPPFGPAGPSQPVQNLRRPGP